VVKPQTIAQPFSLSGTQLSCGLAACLTVAALLLDSRYQSFPTFSLPLWACGLLTVVIGYWGVPWLRALKTGQFIREDGPQAHFKKAGTPTMGGILFVPSAAIAATIWAYAAPGFDPADRLSVLGVALLTLAYGFIGWIDDWQVLRRKSNKGISPKMKLALQILFAIAFCLWLSLRSDLSIDLTQVLFPAGFLLPLGILFWAIAGFTIVSESNATNLTDGLDGLMGGTGAIAFLGLGAIVAPTSPALALFCACMSGGCLGFLAYNRNPARVFMGDTGSLSLGAALAGVAIITNHLFGLLLVTGLFFFETLSVILQVAYYKATKNADGIGKRIFKMAPFHHHLELCGWSELRVVSTFYLITAILSVIAFGLFQIPA